jgi:phage-related baseplate assembly protein
VTLFADAPSTAQPGAQAAAVQLAIDLAGSIGNDLINSQWKAALSVPGVYEVVVTLAATIGSSPLTPDGTGSFVLSAGQWTNCTAITLTFATTSKNSYG